VNALKLAFRPTTQVINGPEYRRHASPSQVINTEWGQFDSNLIPMLSTDRDLDDASSHPGVCCTSSYHTPFFASAHSHLHPLSLTLSLSAGAYRFEKLISGMWLGDAARRIVVKLAKETKCFGAPRPVPSPSPTPPRGLSVLNEISSD
jgi:hexokinase